MPKSAWELLQAGDPSLDLPPGRLVHGDEGDDEKPAMWVSDGPATGDLWRSLRAAQPATGLCPLLLDHLTGDPRRPWDDGELWPGDVTSPSDHDPGALLAQGWRDQIGDVPGDQTGGAAGDQIGDASGDRIAVTAPFGTRWPGLADGRKPPVDPDVRAAHCVDRLLRSDPHLRLGLVPAATGSAALAVAGWQGAVNYTNDTARLSAVLGSWEERFGARVIGAGFADLYVSVAAPPVDHADALRVAAEHFAFCPDNIWQGAGSLTAYAEQLTDAPIWTFWWD
ncbi:DUF4253 domain-containing protein [Actinoplanes bogorensis]|uniref:DUF4253 domain-containing protein n=1 Tax=Paractinoplanes bogorensis TaxID=1610840 RepID=A0ABS5YN48_9ACTN|nr:DUF4253 domain-containing protein [Actinoplanes bogorensis]MBU2664889.1 DUF4253 domain-containing protein [Actinoplanes bogorensis]